MKDPNPLKNKNLVTNQYGSNIEVSTKQCICRITGVITNINNCHSYRINQKHCFHLTINLNVAKKKTKNVKLDRHVTYFSHSGIDFKVKGPTVKPDYLPFHPAITPTLLHADKMT